MISKKEIEAIRNYVSATNYLTATQIYLKDNFLLKKKLSRTDIKPVLLGHWGTCPGINFVYANLNWLIKKYDLDMMFVLGPGHGFPALQANLFLEGSLGKFYEKATLDEKGIAYISKEFSWPYGFPSHSNPGAPGVILEGGELGYSLSTAYGAVLDNPELIVACLIGDGEAETGPLATAWHLNKIIDPKTNGVVLPILHLNGYKISGPTIFGRMSDLELINLFKGYGYKPIIVSEPNVYEAMINALETSYKIIKEIKSGKQVSQPMIILKTPKGWTGIKKFNDDKIEGNFLSHQVPLKDVKTSNKQLMAVETWMKSYKFNKLFSKNEFSEEVLSVIPRGREMGLNKHTFAYQNYKSLKLPNIEQFAEPVPKPGTIGSSSMRRIGAYLNEVFKLNANEKNFRLMSPDETYSNKLDEVFKTTARSFQLPLMKWDKDLSKEGRVMEMLSEHTLQGLAQGYVLTGRHCIFASYEAFIEIVSSMADQYQKFLRIAQDYRWRGSFPSLNYVLTSSGWRQQHNGFSHQNPSFITNLLEKPGSKTHVYFPSDQATTLVVLKKCLESKNVINLIIAGKTVEPRWLTLKQAEEELKEGLATWDFASDKDPDIGFSAVGGYLTKESLAAVELLKRTKAKVRFVNILELTSLGLGNKLTLDFNKYFTKDKPVIFNYHGYPNDLKAILIDKDNPQRFKVYGYIENGSTTTPFDMHVRNKTDRYNLAIEALKILEKNKVLNSQEAEKLIKEFEKEIKEHKEYICLNGDDPDKIKYWKWTDKSRKKISIKDK